ncbi:MAG: ATP-binding protein [Acidobacteria bacterium]|nr:ATP-binding protein [Acidobacteriota bacterium]
MNKAGSSQNFRRVLAQVDPSEFIGRAAQLERIVAHATDESARRGMLGLMEPAAGVSELLRQAYDRIFNQQTEVIPIYFEFTRNDTTAVSAAIEFLNTFLQQYLAFRNDDPSILHATLTLRDIVARASMQDQQWIEALVERYNELRFGKNDRELVRFCLGAPQRIPKERGRPFIMLDGAQLAQYLNGAVPLGTEVLRVFGRGTVSYVLAGLRRQILEAVRDAECNVNSFEYLHLRQLEIIEATLLVEQMAHRQQVEISEMARDLLVQQFGGSPFFINMFLQTARKKAVNVKSKLDCGDLYVAELFGGHLHSYFENLLEEISPRLNTRLRLIAVLWDAVSGKDAISSVETWAQRLNIDAGELAEMLPRLHMYEFINWDGRYIQTGTEPQTWKDYLRIRYQLDVENKPRALVYGEVLSDVLKRAQPTKHSAQVNLGKIVSRFNCQQVPEVLFDYAKFSLNYKGEEPETIASSLDAETEFELPQTVYVANCSSFKIELPPIVDDEHCVIARTFKERRYSDAQEVVWFVACLHEKDAVAVNVATAGKWCERFKALGSELKFHHYQIWLISNSGFTDEALAVLKDYEAFSSDSQQLELLTSRVGETPRDPMVHHSEPSEFRLEMPFGEDNELVAAGTVEQIARRLPFRPDAINQIKMAIVEACINVFEHSFSPDQKISQRFRLESDRLVVTISSRGIVPTNLNGANSRSDTTEAAEARRGYGLILIRSLMDEVEFEPVDDGTSLRMTKYLRDTAS